MLLFLNATNVTKSGFNFKNVEYISKIKDSVLSKGKIRLKDIVITTRGTVGNIAYYSNKIGLKNMRINSGMVIIRSDDKELLNEFLYHSLQSFYFDFNYNKFASGSAQPQLPIKDLGNFMVPIPKINEQLKIIKVANQISNKILLSNVQLEKYKNLKKALMQDLLTGKVKLKR
ncbi:restriction endonuclease subunit S [Silvanigrella sp.]|uniref:restriction endonuclease subunit S n=1 Tax=Silvanigrella sp. TaxID=2024976 RepID=UPI0037C6DCAE